MLLNRSQSNGRRAGRRQPRRGAVVVLVAISLIAIIGVVALSIDGGLLQDRRRHVQAAADASAMSAAADIYKRWNRNTGSDPDGYALNTARTIATANGYNNDGTTSTVVVNIPPTSGSFSGVRGCVEVIITFNETRRFSGIWGDGVLPVVARAVGRAGYDAIGEGIIVLDLNDRGALNAHGGGVATITGTAGVVVNSNSYEAAIVNGSEGAGIYSETGYSITGTGPGYDEVGNATFDGGPIRTGVPPTPDPLAYLPEPDPNSLPTGTSERINLGGGARQYNLTPGVFRGGLRYSGQESVYMAPGIYYMDEGGFSFSGQGDLIAEGVMLYNNPRGQSQNISISGQGIVQMTSMSTGPYQGILLFQDRQADVPVSVTGNGQFSMLGTFYAASALVRVEGNGDVAIGGQYISRTLDIGGNGNFNVHYNASDHPRKRVLQLVE